MCSRLEDDDDDASTVIPKAKPSLTPDRNEKTCMKCKAEPSVVIARTKDPMCGSCFDVYFAHRFRATFGKTKLVRQGEKVLVAFSGGPSSRSMLDLIEKVFFNISFHVCIIRVY
jgi:cytoplasmic tRNA 2-thiolation protein 2